MLAPGTEWQDIAIAVGAYIVALAAVTVIGYTAAVRRNQRAEREREARNRLGTASPSKLLLQNARRDRERGYQTHTVDGQEYATFPDGHTTPIGPAMKRLVATIDSEIQSIDAVSTRLRQEEDAARAARKAELVASIRVMSRDGSLMRLEDYMWARSKGVLKRPELYRLTFDPAPGYDEDEAELLTEVLSETRKHIGDIGA